jgi:CRP-like cAMP-binding protein
VQIIEERSKKVLKILKKGECFGEYSFFTGQARTCSAMSENFSRVYKIPRDVFLEVISDE